MNEFYCPSCGRYKDVKCLGEKTLSGKPNCLSCVAKRNKSMQKTVKAKIGNYEFDASAEKQRIAHGRNSQKSYRKGWIPPNAS